MREYLVVSQINEKKRLPLSISASVSHSVPFTSCHIDLQTHEIGALVFPLEISHFLHHRRQGWLVDNDVVVVTVSRSIPQPAL